VFDLSEAAMQPLLLRQARRAASPKEIGDQCEIAVVSLPTLAAFRQAVLGPDGLAAGGAIKQPGSLAKKPHHLAARQLPAHHHRPRSHQPRASEKPACQCPARSS
jgi:3-hydroxyisobutyrate dehydrogenase-like beta-hydroxyacid dehydrogenase